MTDNNFGDLSNIRREYTHGTLDDSVPASPTDLFTEWLKQAKSAGLSCNECALATSHQGTPSVRIVLLKGFDEHGFCWFSDSTSTKGKALADNPQAELLFYWQPLERQVRVQGDVVLLPDKQTRAYFASRPRTSQLSAFASQQSTPITNRATLERQRAKADEAHADQDIPLPSRWRGYRLIARKIEFWQGREHRLHDRILYTKATSNEKWCRQRLQP